MPQYPFSLVCPNCGSEKFRARRGWFGERFRSCRSCRNRYRLPPTKGALVLGVGTGLSFAPVCWIALGVLCAGIAAVTAANTMGTAKQAEMVTAGWSFAGAMAILALVCLAMARRKHRHLQAQVSSELFKTSEISDAPAAAPEEFLFLVPPERAEEIVRTFAEKHGAKRTLRQLGDVPADKLSNAIDSFAYTIDEEERALVLVDNSFLQNGSAGLLLTNARLYSSLLGKPVGLEKIQEAVLARPDMMERAILPLTICCYLVFCIVFGPVGKLVALLLLPLWILYRPRWTNRLVVNGEVVFAGHACSTDFWPEVLRALGALARQTDDPQVPRSGESEPDTNQTDITSKRPDQ
jgi:hypothetical protein